MKKNRLFTIINIFLVPVLIGLLIYYAFFKDLRAIFGIFLIFLYYLIFSLIAIIAKRLKPSTRQIPSSVFIILLILLIECGIGYLFYLFAVSNALIFALVTLSLFLILSIVLICSRFRDRVKIEPAAIVAKKYSSTFFIIFGVLVGSFVISVIIKTGILIVKNVF